MSESLVSFFSTDVFLPLVTSVVALLLGSIPFGLLVARLFKVKNLRSLGSGNIGATNVTRVVGAWPGLLTLFLDVSKGVLAVFLASSSGQRLLAHFFGIPGADSLSADALMPWVGGLCGVVGHCFSPWLHFKGGKGVATGFGVILVLSPWAALFGLAAFVITFFHRKIASLASITGLVIAAVVHLVWNPIAGNLWIGAMILFVILLRHETNIDALLANRENSF